MAPDDVQFFVQVTHAAKGKNGHAWEEAAVTVDSPGRIYFQPASQMEKPEVE
jgi:hypothetical protein